MPHKKNHKIPYNLWKRHPSSYRYLKVWGCLAKVVVPNPKKVKLGSKTVDCIFISYTRNGGAYHFLLYKSNNRDIQVNTIMESRDAVFFESVFPYRRIMKMLFQEGQ